MNTHLTDTDLYLRQYPIDVLEVNEKYLTVSALVNTQVLTAEFCKKYILDEDRMSVEEQYLIDVDYVLKRQPHLCVNDFTDKPVPSVYITDDDLRKRQYPIDVLEANEPHLSLKTLLYTQVLTAEFCAKYILDEDAMSVEEQYLIDVPYVLKHQPHLEKEELLGLYAIFQP